MEFCLDVLFGDSDEVSMGCSGVLVNHTIVADLPPGCRDVADDDSGPFNRLHEDRLRATLGKYSENGGMRLLRFGSRVNRV